MITTETVLEEGKSLHLIQISCQNFPEESFRQV